MRAVLNNLSSLERLYQIGGNLVPLSLFLCLAFVFGTFLASLVASGVWYFAVALALFLPGTILFVRYPFMAVIVWLLVFPFFVREDSVGGRYVYWVIHRAMIPAALIFSVCSSKFSARRRGSRRFGRAELAMLLFLALGLANILFLNEEPIRTLIRFYDRIFVPFCMYWLVRMLAPTDKDFRRFLWVALITVITQSSIGILSWVAPQALPVQWLGNAGQRTVGTLDNPAVYTSTLIFLSVFLFQHAMQSESQRTRIVFFSTFALAFFCVFLSFSRGSWLGGVTVLVGLAFLYPRTALRLIPAAVLLSVILVRGIVTDYIARAGGRLHDQRTAEGRIVGNAATVDMILERPWFGWGYANHELHDERFKRRVWNISVHKEQSSHNTYLLIMAEMGMVGFLMYILPVGLWLKRSREAWRSLPRVGFRNRYLLALLWLAMLHQFIVSNFMDMIDSFLFGTTIWWMALAFIADLLSPYAKSNSVGDSRFRLLS